MTGLQKLCEEDGRATGGGQTEAAGRIMPRAWGRQDRPVPDQQQGRQYDNDGRNRRSQCQEGTERTTAVIVVVYWAVRRWCLTRWGHACPVVQSRAPASRYRADILRGCAHIHIDRHGLMDRRCGLAGGNIDPRNADQGCARQFVRERESPYGLQARKATQRQQQERPKQQLSEHEVADRHRVIRLAATGPRTYGLRRPGCASVTGSLSNIRVLWHDFMLEGRLKRDG